jgi:hypothetical protein
MTRRTLHSRRYLAVRNRDELCREILSWRGEPCYQAFYELVKQDFEAVRLRLEQAPVEEFQRLQGKVQAYRGLLKAMNAMEV